LIYLSSISALEVLDYNHTI